MSRLIVTFCVLSLFSLIVVAQVKIIVPQQNQKKYETIHASLENAGSKQVTFCIEVGQTSPRGGGEIEATPSLSQGAIPSKKSFGGRTTDSTGRQKSAARCRTDPRGGY
jgi:hypothetical protein